MSMSYCAQVGHKSVPKPPIYHPSLELWPLSACSPGQGRTSDNRTGHALLFSYVDWTPVMVRNGLVPWGVLACTPVTRCHEKVKPGLTCGSQEEDDRCVGQGLHTAVKPSGQTGHSQQSLGP